MELRRLLLLLCCTICRPLTFRPSLLASLCTTRRGRSFKLMRRLQGESIEKQFLTAGVSAIFEPPRSAARSAKDAKNTEREDVRRKRKGCKAAYD